MKKILVVEDDKSMCEIYKDILSEKKDKYTVVFAHDVTEASAKLNKNGFDLVVLDVMMEPMSGLYLYLKLKQDKKFKAKDIPVIICSIIKKSMLMRIGGVENIPIFEKPIDKNKFLKKIDELI